MRAALLALLDRASVAWMRHAPNRLAHGYGTLVARHLAHRLYPEVGQRARENLRRLRPDLDEAAAMEAVWDNLARTLLEAPRCRRLHREGRVEVVGAEHLSHRPLLFAGLHLSSWELFAPTIVATGTDPGIIVQPPPNAYRARVLEEERARAGVRRLPLYRDGTRPALQELRRPDGVLGMFLDENMNGRVGAPSLGRGPRQGGNIEQIAKLARVTGAAIVVGYVVRLPEAPDPPRFRMTFLPPIWVAKSRDREADIRQAVDRIDALIDPIVRDNITQWFMLPDWHPGG